MELTFDDLIPPITDLGEGDCLETWRWLVGPGARPLLLTALGDLFIQHADGSVWFLDTLAGELEPAGRDRNDWKVALQDPNNIDQWFAPDFVAELRSKGMVLAPGQCYQPIVPPIVGGSIDASNYECNDWRVHLFPMGQIHEQVKGLPPGTRITGFKVE